jgi:DNA polymerase III sliding clamp (beta) subunit (PCNA family)
MKFTIDVKELKKLMDKGITVINKKCAVPALTRLYFQVEENGIVKMFGTDMCHYVEVRSSSAYDTCPGVIGIDVDDVKIISKMNGIVSIESNILEDRNEVGKVNIKCGKKTVSVLGYQKDNDIIPDMSNTGTKIMSVKENWLLETIVNLSLYTSYSSSIKMMQVFNFNMKKNRIEALDGYRIGMRSLENQTIYETTENPFETVKIHNMCVPVFKKLMDKKSEKNVIIYQSKKNIRLDGNDFTYIIRRVDGAYYKVDRLLKVPEEFRFIPDRENILDAMKYDAELAKMDRVNKKPVVFHSANGKLYSYIHTEKYEAFDELETFENNMSDNLYVGFDSRYLADVFSIVDSDKPVCFGRNAKYPLIINGNEYSFLILPVNIGTDYNKEFSERNKEEIA